MSSHFKKLKSEVEKGMLGKTQGIPISVDRVSKFLSIRKRIYTLLGGNGGTGKTGYIDSTYVLEPYEWLLENRDKSDIRIEWVYRCMERSIMDKLGKWACYKIWKDHGELIEPQVLMGWYEGKKLTSTQKDIFDSYEEYFTTMQDSHIVNIIAGQENPRGIFKQLEQYALERGTEEQISEWEKKYHPNNEHLIIVPVIDHAGKCRMETVDGVKSRKGTTDKLSEYMSIVRDRFEMAPVVISQFNRSIKSEIYSKQADPEPTQESFKDTGNMYDDADVVLTLFNPYKFKVYDHMGYEIQKFVDTTNGNNLFRSLKLIKSSYSADDMRWAMAFNGAIGQFKTLPKLDKQGQIDPQVIEDVKSLQYFRKQEPAPVLRPYSGMSNERARIMNEIKTAIT